MYTNEDLVNIERAIFELQMGKRAVAVWHGDMKVEYAQVDLDKLLALRSQIKSGLEGYKTTKQAHFCTSKGV